MASQLTQIWKIYEQVKPGQRFTKRSMILSNTFIVHTSVIMWKMSTLRYRSLLELWKYLDEILLLETSI